MKRALLVLVCLLLCSLVLPVFAADTPEITLQPQNYHFTEYGTAIYTVKATGTNLSATWYLEYEGKIYNISDMTNGIEPWEGYAGETYGPNEPEPGIFTYFFGGIGSELNGAEIWCVIEDGHYDVTSDHAIITIQGEKSPPEIKEIPTGLEVAQGAEAEIRCVAWSVDGEQLSFQWYETDTGKLQDIRAISGEECDFLILNTDQPGVRYFVCCVTGESGGMTYSSIVPVSVAGGGSAEPDETTPATTPETTPASTPAATQPTAQPAGETGQTADFPWWGILLIALGAAAVGVGATLLIAKTKKK